MKQYLEFMYKKSKKDYFKYLKSILDNNVKKFIITANPETLMFATDDNEISNMLLDKNNSIIPDGIAIIKAGKVLGIDFEERIPGIDVCEYLLRYASSNNKKVYLFGSKEEVINAMKEKIKKEYTGINLAGAKNGYIKDRDKEFGKIKKAKPDIVLIALGIPYQEKLIYKHIKDFDKGVFVGVGGSFDVISGQKKRAPRIFIKLNLEWAYRIICEPRRLKRFWNNNIKFMYRVYKEK